MDMERKFGLTTQSTKVNTTKERNMEKGHMYGLMEVCMRETGLRTELRGMGPIPGQTAGNLQGLGRIIICMDMESILGKMAEGTKAIMKWTRSMDMVYINGLMEESTRAIG